MRILTLTVLSLGLVACNKDATDDGTDTGTILDADGDGFDASTDCDDDNADINPDAIELCDEVDNDCDGDVDEADAEDALTWYADTDADGFGDANASEIGCVAPEGFVEDATDCDDTVAEINPDADEYCNEIDDDCDTEIDEDAMDMGSYYVDGDGDGYGWEAGLWLACTQPEGTVDNGEDCDDENAAVNPDALEACDGVDNDCDTSTSEDGTAAWTDSTGAITDVTASVTGSEQNPAVFTVPGGTLNFCDGTYYVNLKLEGDVNITSQSEDPSLTVLDGAGSDSVIQMGGVTEDAVSIVDVSITGGNGGGVPGIFEDVGGGVLCGGLDPNTFTEVPVELSIDNVLIYGNNAVLGAGGLLALGCNLTISNSEFSSNTAGVAGGLAVFGGTHTLTEVDIIDNMANEYAAGLDFEQFMSLPVVTLDSVRVSGNDVGSEGASGGYISADTVSWVGTAGSGTSGVYGNTGPEETSGLLVVANEFIANLVDFGTEADGTDNDGVDLYFEPFTGDYGGYQIEDDASFTCDADFCGTPTTAVLGTNTYEGQLDAGFLIGNVIEATTDDTLDSFAYDLTNTVSSNCRARFAVLSTSAVSTTTTTTWDVIWTSALVPVDKTAVTDSGFVGLPVESGLFYGLGVAANCELTVTFDPTTTNTTGGFGTGVGYFGLEVDQSFWPSSTVDVEDYFSEYGAMLHQEVTHTDL